MQEVMEVDPELLDVDRISWQIAVEMQKSRKVKTRRAKNLHALQWGVAARGVAGVWNEKLGVPRLLHAPRRVTFDRCERKLVTASRVMLKS